MKSLENTSRTENRLPDFAICTFHTVLQHPVLCSEDVVRFVLNSSVLEAEVPYQLILYLDANYSVMAHSSWRSHEHQTPQAMTRVVAENAFCLDAKSIVAATVLRQQSLPPHLNQNMLLNLRLFGSLLRIPVIDHVVIMNDCWISINQFGHTAVFEDRPL